MSYLLLIHEPVGQRATRSEAEGRAAYDEMQGFAAELQSRVDGCQLQAGGLCFIDVFQAGILENELPDTNQSPQPGFLFSRALAPNSQTG